ncbi:ABC transporter permease [Desulfobacterales bacterium HSG16]|nr:ABC transporter permease [Desulfobacterales bacterium HSG16]
MNKMEDALYIHPVNRKDEWKKFWNLIWALSAREIKGRYRRSLLGPFWAVLQPLFYMVIFTFIRGMLDIPSDGIPYVVFTYSVLVPWTFFSNVVARCAPSIMANASLVKKISIRREVFPAASIITAFLDFLIASIILVLMMIWFEVPLSLNLLWVPVLMVLTASLALGIGLGASALGTYKQDISMVLPFVMQFWILATPIMYPLSKVPLSWLPYYRLNPMVGLIDAYRNVLIKAIPPDLTLLLISVVELILIWAVALTLFRKMSRYFADVL